MLALNLPRGGPHLKHCFCRPGAAYSATVVSYRISSATGSATAAVVPLSPAITDVDRFKACEVAGVGGGDQFLIGAFRFFLLPAQNGINDWRHIAIV